MYIDFLELDRREDQASRETTWMWMISFIEKLAFIFLVSHDVEILITLPYGKRCVRSEQLMAEDLGQEDVVGLVSGFKLVAADGAVGRAEVAGFPGFVQRAESGGNVFRQLRARGGVNGIGARECFQGPELIERTDDLLWIGQDRDRVRLEAGAWSVAGFELAIKDEGGEGSFLGGKLKLALKKISAGRRPVSAIRPMPFSR